MFVFQFIDLSMRFDYNSRVIIVNFQIHSLDYIVKHFIRTNRYVFRRSRTLVPSAPFHMNTFVLQHTGMLSSCTLHIFTDHFATIIIVTLSIVVAYYFTIPKNTLTLPPPSLGTWRPGIMSSRAPPLPLKRPRTQISRPILLFKIIQKFDSFSLLKFT